MKLKWIAALFVTFGLSRLALAQDTGGPKPPPVQVTLNDGLHFTTPEGDTDIMVGGYLGLHYRVFAHRPADNVRTSPDTFFVRQARPEISGFVYRDFDFRFQMDFPTGTASAVTGTVQDAYVGWRYWPELSLRFGQFKEPFGQEQTTPDRFINMDERSDFDRLVPGRDLGAMVYGSLWSGLLSYEAGAFNGQGRAVVDATDDKEVAGRLRSFPFAGSEPDFLLHRLRLGLAGTAGTVTKSGINGLDFTSTGLNVLFLDATAGQLDGPRTRFAAELTWAYGPFELRAEEMRRTDSVDLGAARNRKIRSTGGKVSASWLVTGEEKPIETRVVPLHPFDPRTGSWGAIELAARAARLKIDDDVFDLGVASSATNSNGLTTYALGVNWYLNRGIRISPNVFIERYDDEIQFADGSRRRHFYGGILRLQLEF
jgi:phosphate-selective porin OprO/OprP